MNKRPSKLKDNASHFRLFDRSFNSQRENKYPKSIDVLKMDVNVPTEPIGMITYHNQVTPEEKQDNKEEIKRNRVNVPPVLCSIL